MSSVDTLEALKEWNDLLVQDVVDQLNQIGIVSDEDGQGFSSIWIEYWDENCTSYFRKFGYVGGPLNHHAKFFADHGAVYVLYDEDKNDMVSAEKYLESRRRRESGKAC